MSVQMVDAARLRALVGFEDLIEPVSRAFQDFSAGLAQSGIVIMYPGSDPALGDAYVKTGCIRGHSHYLVKVSPWFALNRDLAQPQGGFVAVFDYATGHTAAIFNDEHYLSDIRTAAAGALAARVLAPKSVRVAGILGTGVQAYWQARALFSERKFERLLIWGRDREKALGLKGQLAPWLPGVEIEVIGNVKEVVEAAEVLVTATTAREPIVRGEWLRPGQHITAVGADDNTKCELDAECVKRANRLIVDSRESARDYGEVHRWLKQGALRIEDIHGELGEVLAGMVPGRRSSEEITIAKLVGIGVQDLAAAEVSIDKLKQSRQDLLSSISGFENA
jgi:ornithine cyclodeaminase/alanine dehydrogenase-like protein (mu-crystallin family)